MREFSERIKFTINFGSKVVYYFDKLIYPLEFKTFDSFYEHVNERFEKLFLDVYK